MLTDIHLVQAERERSAIGLYATGHPLRFITRKAQLDRTTHALTAANLWTTVTDQQVCMVGRVVEVREQRDVNKRVMGFITMEDSTGEYSVVVFCMQFKMFASILFQGAVLKLYGTVSHQSDLFRRKKTEATEGEDGEIEEETTSAVKYGLILNNAELWED